MMFYSENVWSSQFDKRTKRCIHWIIQVIGSSLALSGIVVQHINYKGEHFQTIHSVIGLISAIFLLISLCGGVCALKSFHLRNVLRPASVKFCHYAVAIIAIVFGIVKIWKIYRCKKSLHYLFHHPGLAALCYGYDKRFMRAHSDEDIRFYLQLIAGSTAIFSTIGALQSLYRKVKAILWTNWNFLQLCEIARRLTSWLVASSVFYVGGITEHVIFYLSTLIVHALRQRTEVME